MSFRCAIAAASSVLYLASSLCLCSSRCRAVCCRPSASNAKSHRKPATGRVAIPLNKHRRDGSTRAAKTIQAATVQSHYRPDLVQHAVARYHALYKASKAKEGQGVNLKRRRTPAKERRAQKAAASA